MFEKQKNHFLQARVRKRNNKDKNTYEGVQERYDERDRGVGER